MELRNYCVIDLDRYNDLVNDKVEHEKIITELNERLRNNDNIFNSLENCFFEKVIRNEYYHINNFKEYNDYHYIHLADCFRKIGINDDEYIDRCIIKIKEKYEKEKDKGDEQHGD